MAENININGVRISQLPTEDSPAGFEAVGYKSGRTSKVSLDLLATKDYVQDAVIGTNILGSKADIATIKSGITTPSKGDTYKADDTGHYWKYNDAISETNPYDPNKWVDIGIIIPSDVMLSGGSTKTGQQLDEATQVAQTSLRIISNRKYIMAVADSGDKILLGLDKNGYLDFNNRVMNAVKPIFCVGDSLTAAGVYKTEMQNILGADYKVINGGVGGEDTFNISARVGAMQAYLLNAVTIPSGGTEVQIGTLADSNIRIIDCGGEIRQCKWMLQGEGDKTVNPVLVEGIQCTLRWTGASYNDPAGVYTLRRNTSTTANYTTQAKASIITNSAKIYRNPFAMVIWIGTNGGWISDPSRLVAQYRKIIDFYNCGNYVCLGLHTGDASSRAALEAEMVKELGNRYINLREYFSTRAIRDAGLTPTQADIDAMEIGACPPTFIPDGVHMTTTGYQLVGRQIIERYTQLGIIKM